MTGLSLSSTSKKPPMDTEQSLIAGKRRRKMREALIGYLFVLPAALATVIFGLWPVIAGFYESIKAGSPITNKYVGMANYTRALGSLIYILLFALCAIFLLMAYRSWQKMAHYRQEHGGNPWLYLVPGMLVGLGLIILALILVTGVDGYGWAGLIPLLLGVGGLFTADFLQSGSTARDARPLATVWSILAALAAVWLGGPWLNDSLGLGTLGWIVLVAAFGAAIYALVPRLGSIRTGQYVGGSLTMGTFMLLALLLARYTVLEMSQSTDDARRIAAQIFNQRVLDGVVSVTQTNAQITGLKFEDGEVIVKVNVNGQTLDAPLAPQVYNELPVDKITRIETAFANGQKVQVVLPDGSVAEGQLTGIAQGEKLNVDLTADNPQATSEIDIYSALDVGEAVIQNNGHTEPLQKQIYASLGILLGLATIYHLTWVRRHTDDDEHPRLYHWLHRGRVLMGIAVVVMFYYLVGAAQLSQQAAAGMGALSEDQFKLAYQFATGQAPPAILRAEMLKAQLLYWPQAFSVGIGALLIGAAYLVWQSAQKRETPLGFSLTILLAVFMMVGGWLVLGELPRTLSLGGRETQDALDALRRTAIYSIGTVPIQLALGLFLAYLLFSEVKWGKSLYRVIYFMPYIAPSVATSTVFLVIFRLEPGSLANRFIGLFGVAPQTWLKEPNGIFRIIYEQVLGGNPLNIPAGLAGPSLALTTVILYNIWVFAGYNTVVFLAGLGAIPTELYEAAEVDGAGRWSRFRSITLPLLSPTTFFLSMLSIIGTFKAFTHIYVLRRQATGKEIDTMSVHIFNTLYSANDPGYAAALAFTLFGVILVLTLVQNRLAKEQVFYG